MPSKTDANSAHAYVQLWRARAELLESERLHDLRALSELDAARRFTLLQHYPPAASKPTSGLVEQQRMLRRLYQAPG
ncbi:MAG TPA: hypothetical protein VFM15_09365 [Gammaproteobacteria bacterium]|nr:hypothetical protein [Gammaproteobacteria bacterium]